MSEPVNLFLLGVGFIGGSLLTTLRASTSPKYKITALTRHADQAETLKSLGVQPLLGSLDDHDKILKATIENDVIVHAATADDEPSVLSILEGLKPENRPAGSAKPVYLHTSGTGVLISDPEGSTPPKQIYSDLDPDTIDTLDDAAPHRNIDLLIRSAVLNGKVGEARVAIILPPLIFGIGTGPFNKLSIQVPGWIKASIASKKVSVHGTGATEWNHIHVSNLVRGYTTILSYLSSARASPPSPLYFFAEQGHHTWLSLGTAIHTALSAKGLVEGELETGAPADFMGTNSRSNAGRLRELGWKPVAEPTVWESVQSELEEILKL